MKIRKNSLFNLVLGLSLTAAMLVLHGLQTPLGLTARDAITDAYLRADPRMPAAERPVAIVDIDDDSLAAIGQWPWPRTVLADLVARLFDLGALVVGLDAIFPEPDRASGPEGDLRFAETLAAWPTVLSVVGAQAGGPPERKAGLAWTGDDPTGALIRYPGHVGNLPELSAAATGLGSISLAPGRDGVVRRVPMLTVMGGETVPALSAEMLRVAQGAGSYALRTTQAQGEGAGGVVRPVALRVGALTVPLDERGEMNVRFSRPEDAVYIPAASILAGHAPDPDLRAQIEGRLILVGASAPGLFDLRTTPLAPGVPGVSIHADVIGQILQGDFLTRPDWMAGLERLGIAVAGLTLTLCLVFERPILGLALMVVWVAGAVWGGYWAFDAHGLIFDPVAPVLTAVLVVLPGASLGVVQKERARRAVRARFAHFLPPGLIAAVADDPDRALTPEGAERVLTVMFVDIRGFSTITENMAPEDVVTLVNTCLAELTRSLLSHGATIDKFMGDAVMAFWNAPIEVEAHEARAVTAAMALKGAMDRVNVTLVAHHLPAVSIGAGVNTGPCFVGLMGSSDRLSYTCIGDVVNLAARLEGLTRIYGVRACFGAASLADLPAGLRAVELDVIAVKGRSKAEPVYAVFEESPASRAFSDALTAARAAYLRRDWDLADARFTDLAALAVEGCDVARLTGLYKARMAELKRSPPPPGWDGRPAALSK